MSKKTLCLLYMPILLYLFLFPAESFQASLCGVNLWFDTVLPSLLPFLILSNILFSVVLPDTIMKRLAQFTEKWLRCSPFTLYACGIGILCGYPMGAKLSSDLLLKKRISKSEAQFILCCANQVSPMFINTYIGVYVFQGNRKLLNLFTFIFYLSVFTTIFSLHLYRISKKSPPETIGTKKEVPNEHSQGALLDTSIMNGFETITRLGGYIILFSIYGSLIKKLTVQTPVLHVLSSNLLELTSGLAVLQSSNYSSNTKLLLALFSATFGGISTIYQTKCVIAGSKLSILYYVCIKLIQTLIALLLGLIFIIL